MGTTPQVGNSLGPIIFFDGVCNLCSGSVRFVICRDKNQYFKFASLQSPLAKDLFNQHEVEEPYESIVLLDKGDFYTRSDAVLAIVRKMDFPWPLLYGLKIFPRFFRDIIYDFIARYRYKWFGKSDQCMIPNAEISKRFVG